MRSLVEEQRLLQVARGRDFLRMSTWARRVALVAAYDSLALQFMAGMRTLPIRVENCSFPHDSSLVLLLFA